MVVCHLLSFIERMSYQLANQAVYFLQILWMRPADVLHHRITLLSRN